MYYVLTHGTWERVSPDRCALDNFPVSVISLEDVGSAASTFCLDMASVEECLRRQAFTFEHHDKTDYIGIWFLNKDKTNEAGAKYCLCAGKNRLMIMCENSGQVETVVRDLIPLPSEAPVSISGLFLQFMEKAIAGHIQYHERIEDDIAALENDFLMVRKNLGPGRILVLRKKLLVFKRYYEQLQNVLDEIQETRYGLVDDDHMRVMTLYIRRIDRLLSNILVLREYVTQVRESYEAETDINLNSIMRLFTVVTVIFLPLTLLVGWYGMNLPMPEYQWSWSYPLVIALSLMIVVLTILIFRKNKWF